MCLLMFFIFFCQYRLQLAVSDLALKPYDMCRALITNTVIIRARNSATLMASRYFFLFFAQYIAIPPEPPNRNREPQSTVECFNGLSTEGAHSKWEC